MSADASPLVAVYADESCLGNGREGDNPGAAGILVEYQAAGRPVDRRDAWISEPSTTNNRMALRSVIESFRLLSVKGRAMRVIFVTDSRYIVDGMTSWVHGWAARGWRRKTGEIENLRLWQEAVEAAARYPVDWRWVRGHNGHAQNEYANHLAVRAATEQNASDGLIPSGFDEWLLESNVRRRAKLDPDPFPTATSFRAARPLPGLSMGRL